MKGISLMLACLMVFSVGLYGQEALTIDAVISMVKAKLRSRTIVQKVNLSSMQYAPSVDDIVRLKKAGASRRVVDAVLAAPVTGPSEVPATSSPMSSPEPWTSSSTMASSEPEATSPKPRSGGLEEGAYPKIELFGGYSRLGTEGGVGLNGLNIAFSYNFIDWLGLVVDSSDYYTDILGIDVSVHSLHFGPQFAFRFNRVTPFVRPLVGFSIIKAGLLGVTDSITGFSFGFGGGLDVKVANHVAIRAVQFDYVNIRVGGFGSDNARLSLGVVGRW